MQTSEAESKPAMARDPAVPTRSNSRDTSKSRKLTEASNRKEADNSRNSRESNNSADASNSKSCVIPATARTSKQQGHKQHQRHEQ